MSRPASTIPAQQGYGEYLDRGSRFLAWVFHAPDADAFESRLAELYVEHAKARHHCWAWQIGKAYRFNDDGEPGGTAGRPMLQVLEGSELEDVAAICVRYFGGVKLGTGGLARAYSGATAIALQEAGVRKLEARSTMKLEMPFSFLGLRTEIEALFSDAVFAGDFYDRGWCGTIDLASEQVEHLEAFLAEKAKGAVILSLV
jgi:uncharacterized YigZ family protein